MGKTDIQKLESLRKQVNLTRKILITLLIVGGATLVLFPLTFILVGVILVILYILIDLIVVGAFGGSNVITGIIINGIGYSIPLLWILATSYGTYAYFSTRRELRHKYSTIIRKRLVSSTQKLNFEAMRSIRPETLLNTYMLRDIGIDTCEISDFAQSNVNKTETSFSWSIFIKRINHLIYTGSSVIPATDNKKVFGGITIFQQNSEFKDLKIVLYSNNFTDYLDSAVEFEKLHLPEWGTFRIFADHKDHTDKVLQTPFIKKVRDILERYGYAAMISIDYGKVYCTFVQDRSVFLAPWNQVIHQDFIDQEIKKFTSITSDIASSLEIS